MNMLKQAKIIAKVSIKYEGLYEQIMYNQDTVCWIDPEVDNNLLLLLSQNVWSILIDDIKIRLNNFQDGREVIDWEFSASIYLDGVSSFKFIKNIKNPEITIIKEQNV